MARHEGWKVLTHDYRPPVRGGAPVWDGKRKTLDRVKLDTGSEECASGWHFCRAPETALQLAGLWPNGRPSVLLRVQGSRDTIERGNKLRCSRLTILDVADEQTVRESIERLSEPFGSHRERMVESQLEWRHALGRPVQDRERVERFLRDALAARDLTWPLVEYDSARAVWSAWAGWGADLDADLDAYAAWDRKAPLYAWDGWAARTSWDTYAAWADWDAYAASAARDALIVEYGARRGWTDQDPEALTVGLRDAYAYGLGVAVPVPGGLGWAMEGQ